jgi:YesN/AraC family two-component response regulator
MVRPGKILWGKQDLQVVWSRGLIGTEMVRDQDYDLVLYDIKVPKMDGGVLEAN